MKGLEALLACVLVVTAAMSSQVVAAGQAESSSAAPINSESYVFPPTQLGMGWSQAGEWRQTFENDDPWSSGTVRVYSGPLGARVIAMAYVVKPNRTAIVGAAKAIDELAFDYEYDLFSAADEISNLPSVVGCASRRGIEGTDDVVYRGGFMSCTIGLEVVLIAVTSGNVLNLNGVNASAAVLGLMVKAGEQAGSPIATPGLRSSLPSWGET